MGLKSAAIEMFKDTGAVDPSLGVVVDGCIKWRPRGMSNVRWRIERRRLMNARYYSGLSDAQIYTRTRMV